MAKRDPNWKNVCVNCNFEHPRNFNKHFCLNCNKYRRHKESDVSFSQRKERIEAEEAEAINVAERRIEREKQTTIIGIFLVISCFIGACFLIYFFPTFVGFMFAFLLLVLWLFLLGAYSNRPLV